MNRVALHRRAALGLTALLVALVAPACHQQARLLAPELRHTAKLPLLDDSVRFAVIGDTGSGNAPQYEVGERMTEIHTAFPFEFVIMLGDNLYGLERPVDYANKFERPYAKLLEQGVKFYAALGNHDNPNQRFFEPFNMGGQRYYSFTKGDVKFFALDSNYMDEEQLAWLKKELEGTGEPWKIAFFHHPLYSSGGFHGSEFGLREQLEPLFVEHDVRVVFSGHEHFYERIKPQGGVYYFIAGASARLRRGNILNTQLTAFGYDDDNSFMLVEIQGDMLYFEALARTGALIETGQIARSDESNAPGIEPTEPERPGPKTTATPQSESGESAAPN
jgi:predicted phosphodiesterase